MSAFLSRRALALLALTVGCSSSSSTAPGASPGDGGVIADAAGTDASREDAGAPDAPGGDAEPASDLLLVASTSQDVQVGTALLRCTALALLGRDGSLVPIAATDEVSVDGMDPSIAAPAADTDCPFYGLSFAPYVRQVGFVGMSPGVTAARVHWKRGTAQSDLALRLTTLDSAYTLLSVQGPLVVARGASANVFPFVVQSNVGLSYPVPRWLTVTVADATIATLTPDGAGWKLLGVGHGETTAHVAYAPVGFGAQSVDSVLASAEGTFTGGLQLTLTEDDGNSGTIVEPGTCLTGAMTGTYRDDVLNLAYTGPAPNAVVSAVGSAWTPDPKNAARFCINGVANAAIKGCSGTTCTQIGVLSMKAADVPAALTVTPTSGAVAAREILGSVTAFCPNLRVAVTPKTGPAIDVTANPSMSFSWPQGGQNLFGLAFDDQGAALLNTAGNRCIALQEGGEAAGSKDTLAVSTAFGGISGGTQSVELDF